MKKILFSPVGHTDPISGQYDGALLHITRKYKPDKIYLYMSKEICRITENDNRYKFCLEKLQKQINKKYEIIEIKRSELDDVHIFDYFLLEYQELIKEIKNDNANSQLILNVSSGTPAMKSALQTLATMTEGNILPVQVSTPNKDKKFVESTNLDYDVELQWESNLDNTDEYQDRCSVSSNINMATKIKEEIIKKHLDAYDYVAALRVVDTMADTEETRIRKLIQIGVARQKLDRATCTKLIKRTEYDLYPIKTGNECDMFEYLLLLKTKIDKEEFADFARAISPVFFAALEKYIIEKLSFDLYRFYRFVEKNNYKMKEWNDDAREDKIVNEIIRNNSSNAIYSWQLIKIIVKIDPTSTFLKTAKQIRTIEEDIRNPAAHSITSITEDTIKRITGYTPKKILGEIKKLMIEAGIKISGEDMESYKKLNEEIKKDIGDIGRIHLQI